MRTFTSKHLQDRANATRLQIARWSELGLINVYKDARGRGRTRRFSLQNLCEAILCKRLAGLGMDTFTIKTVLDYLRRDKCIFEKATGQKWSLWEFISDRPESTGGLFLGLSINDEGRPRHTTILKRELVESFFFDNPVALILNITDVIKTATA